MYLFTILYFIIIYIIYYLFTIYIYLIYLTDTVAKNNQVDIIIIIFQDQKLPVVPYGKRSKMKTTGNIQTWLFASLSLAAYKCNTIARVNV